MILIVGIACFVLGVWVGAEAGRSVYNKKMDQIRGMAESIKRDLPRRGEP